MLRPEFDWGQEFDEFLNDLNSKDKAKIERLIEKIEEYGLLIAIQNQWVKKLEDNLFEIRDNHNGIFLRGIYFQVKENQYYISNGFKKKTDKTPESEKNKGKLTRTKFFKALKHKEQKNFEGEEI